MIIALTILAILAVSSAIWIYFSNDWVDDCNKPLNGGAFYAIIKSVLFMLLGIFFLLLATMVKINPFW